MSTDILKQIKLLYVEDDESIRKILARGLQRRVKELCVAKDGQDGLEKFKSFNPDVIVTDIKMPNMSGLEMTKLIKEQDPNMPIIITSAHGETDTLLEAIEYGVSGYILKPINTDKLFNSIRTFAKIKVLEDEVESKNRQLLVQSKNAAIGELIENIAHQWRQPLSVISTIAGSMQLKNEFNSLEKEFVAESTEKITSITKKLSDTIDYFRNAYVTANDTKDQFYLQSSIDSALYSINKMLKENSIEIVSNMDSTIVMNNYPNLFLQSIIHLVSNSIEALEESEVENRYIFIDAFNDDESITIEIKDNAGGIPEDVIEHIFEPYYTTHHKCEGKGLGLHTVLQMIQNGMSGSIDVINENFIYKEKEYTGALFTIKLK